MAGGTFISFLISGFIALLTSYSYAKFSITYPSPGGTVEFLNQAFGTGVFSGSLNILLWKHIFITGTILLMTFLNLMSSRVVGEAEEGIVAFKVGILLLFILLGLWECEN